MTDQNGPARQHPAARTYAREHRQGLMDRREFLARATSLGVSAGAAYALIGATRPAGAAEHARAGGTLRVQMTLRALKDTRTHDWSEQGNITRGFLEYLVEYENDGTLRGMLLDRWEIDDTGTIYTLHVRPGILWSNGDPFTAADVARNIDRWCDRSVPGNSMAGRMATLVDPDTDAAQAGAIEVLDDLTLRLTLRAPDISLIAGMSDYPAAVVHASYDPEETAGAVGTGPYRLAEYQAGARAVLERLPDHVWWGTKVFGGPYLDRIEYLDVGTDPAAWLAALEAGEVDMLHESVGDFIDVMDAAGYVRSEVLTMATVTVRPNQLAEVDGMRPYADVRVRKALAMAVDNKVVLELGYGNRGAPAQNHHVGPKHPEYSDIGDPVYDPAAARKLMEEAEMANFTHELVSVDDEWRRNTADAVAAFLADAGIPVRRRLVSAAVYAEEWPRFPFSATNWNHRPLGVQIHALAYRSGEAWNEFGWSNPEFDALLAEALSLADAGHRAEVTAKMEQLIVDEGVTIQPYWRALFRHSRAGLTGVDMHIAFEHHHYKWAFSA